MPTETSITDLLAQWNDGDPDALEALMPLVIKDLRSIARRVADDVAGTLQPTALVNELFLKLVDSKEVSVADRSHFLALSAHIMRHVVTDYARRRLAQKRGGDVPKVPLDEAMESVGVRTVYDDSTLVALNEAMTQLETLNPTVHRIVELRVYGGFGHQEISDLLDMPVRTVRRRWTTAKAMLFDLMKDDS